VIGIVDGAIPAGVATHPASKAPTAKIAVISMVFFMIKSFF
jgi:hypothetical protein